MTGDNSAMPVLDTLVATGDAACRRPGGVAPAMAACCRRALPIGTVVGGPGGYRVALLADAASSEDVEVLAFRQAAGNAAARQRQPASRRGRRASAAAAAPPTRRAAGRRGRARAAAACRQPLAGARRRRVQQTGSNPPPARRRQ